MCDVRVFSLAIVKTAWRVRKTAQLLGKLSGCVPDRRTDNDRDVANRERR
jgi:hypothetical protein